MDNYFCHILSIIMMQMIGLVNLTLVCFEAVVRSRRISFLMNLYFILLTSSSSAWIIKVANSHFNGLDNSLYIIKFRSIRVRILLSDSSWSWCIILCYFAIDVFISAQFGSPGCYLYLEMAPAFEGSSIFRVLITMAFILFRVARLPSIIVKILVRNGTQPKHEIMNPLCLLFCGLKAVHRTSIKRNKYKQTLLLKVLCSRAPTRIAV